MDRRIQEELQESIVKFRLPRYDELPDVGLYLEQVVRYVNRYLEICSDNEITPSMVSNYVKQKIIPGPTKKSYNSDSIAYLIFVAFMKNVLSMDQIKEMERIKERSYPTDISYNYFCSELENTLQYVYGMKESPDEIGTDDTIEKELLRAAVIAIARKIYLCDNLRVLSNVNIENIGEDVKQQ